MADMSNSEFIQGIINIDDLSFASYDYHAAQKMKSYLDVIREASDRIFISSLSFSDHMFETAEKALQIDLKRLKRKIDRQFSRRISETKALKEQLRKISIEFGDQKSLCHPANNYPNGKLTLRGKEICYRLFDRGFSTLTIAYAMRMSLTAIRRRKKKWEELGGSHRPSVHFSARPLRQAQRSAKNG